jgi:hypothetical protein
MIDRRRARTTCWLVALVVLAAACGGGETELEMGLRRVTLDLAFESDDVDPQRRVEDLPPVVQTDFALTSGNQLVVRPAPPTALHPVVAADCPTAAPGAVPAEPVTVSITKPPVAGLYPTHNDGTLHVQSGAYTFEGPYPPHGRVEIADVTDETEPPDSLGQPGARTIEFDHVVPVGNQVTTTRYRVTSAELLLVSRQITTPDAEFSFTPTPAVTIMKLGTGEGDTWTAAGTDLATGASMVVDGEILQREAVDLCGEMLATYRVRSSERLVLLTGPDAFTQVTDDTATEDGKPNFYNVATHLGGLFVRTESHLTTTIGALVVEEDNVSTFDSAAPAHGFGA